MAVTRAFKRSQGGPAFKAYQSSAQTLANTTFTKISFDTEVFDTASCYDNSTNYRFTPNVAGYYYIKGMVRFAGTSDGKDDKNNN